MKILLDTADVNAIRRAYEYFPLDGVTTNPSILAAAGRAPYEVLGEIRDLLGKDGGSACAGHLPQGGGYAGRGAAHTGKTG